MTGPQVFRVALDMPLRRVFDYLAPKGPAIPVETGVAGAVVGGGSELGATEPPQALQLVTVMNGEINDWQS